MEQALKCPQCGKLNTPGPSLCAYCGASLRGAVRVDVEGSVAPAPGQPVTPVEVTTTRVVVADINMPFGSMVVFMIKWALASIPAMIVLLILALIVGGLFGGLAGLMRIF